MQTTDNNPKGNDPVSKPPTNAEIVQFLRHTSLHFALHKDKATMDQSLNFQHFEFRTDIKGVPHVFEAQFTDLATFKVTVTSTKEALVAYPRGKALKYLLYDVCFPDVETFAIACRNAGGDNTETVDLARSIFVNGKCVDEAIDALDDERFAKPVAEPTNDKTDDKDIASSTDDKTGNEQEVAEKQLANEVKNLQNKMHILVQLITMFAVRPDFPRYGE
jgi:hypothetical protein